MPTGFFLALGGQALLMMSACCAIAGGGDDGRICLWPSCGRPGLPIVFKGSLSTDPLLAEQLPMPAQTIPVLGVALHHPSYDG